MQSADLAMLRDIPGYKIIMKAVIKHQIQQLVRHEAFSQENLSGDMGNPVFGVSNWVQRKLGCTATEDD